jgi:hypothetical protein
MKRRASRCSGRSMWPSKRSAIAVTPPVVMGFNAIDWSRTKV